MGRNNGLGRIKEDRKKLSFFKIFQKTDLSSECMRAIPYNFMRSMSPKDFSYKMVIRAHWGSLWEVEISKNPRFYYMGKHGWNQFVSDNALGENEFVTFTHNGKMRFSVNIYEQDGKEIVIPRKMAPSSGIKKEEGESIYKVVKKEEETSESMGGHELGDGKKKIEEAKTSKKKKITSKKVETGESTGGVKLRVKKQNIEDSKTSKEKEIKSKTTKNGVPEFQITITKSYLMYLAIPKRFAVDHIPKESRMFTIHHSNGNSSWEVISLVSKTRAILSSGWSLLAREYPLLIGERCTFKLIKPTEFLLVVSNKDREDITMIDC